MSQHLTLSGGYPREICRPDFRRRAPIRVSLSEHGDDVELCFHNYGRPIPAERIGKIFSPFERGGNKRSADGLGLGLYIAASIVKAHGGKITVDSSEMDGTRFVVTIPRREPRAAAL